MGLSFMQNGRWKLKYHNNLLLSAPNPPPDTMCLFMALRMQTVTTLLKKPLVCLLCAK